MGRRDQCNRGGDSKFRGLGGTGPHGGGGNPWISDLPEPHEEVLDNDVLLPADGEVVRLNQDLIMNGEGRQV